MHMKNPMPPGEILKGEIEELGFSVAGAASKLGCTRQQLYRVLNGTSSITPEMAFAIARVVGGSPELWLRMQVSHQVAQIKKKLEKGETRRLKSKAA